MAGSAVVAAGGRLSPVIARRAPRPVDQAPLRGVGGTLVLAPVGSGWNTRTALAVGVRSGGPLARLEIPACRAAAAMEDLETFGPLTAQSYREPTSGACIQRSVSPGASAADPAPFARDLAQVTGRPGLERLQVERAAARFSGAW
jgi:hypothetical protein